MASKRSTAPVEVLQPEAPLPDHVGINSIHEAIVRAQRAISGVKKDARASTGQGSAGYAYASSEELISACRAALHSVGLAVTRSACKVTAIQSTVVAPAPVDAGGGPVFSGKDKEVVGPYWSSDIISVESEFTIHWFSEGDLSATLVQHQTFLGQPSKGRPWDKATASAMTSSLGYYLRDLLQIPRGNFEDLNTGGTDDWQPGQRAGASGRTPRRDSFDPTAAKGGAAPAALPAALAKPPAKPPVRQAAKPPVAAPAPAPAPVEPVAPVAPGTTAPFVLTVAKVDGPKSESSTPFRRVTADDGFVATCWDEHLFESIDGLVGKDAEFVIEFPSAENQARGARPKILQFKTVTRAAKPAQKGGDFDADDLNA